MRAIIDNGGLREAAQYYSMFRRETSINLPLDFPVDPIDTISNITMEAVLDRILVAVRNSETEVMIVAHGEPRGFLMPMARGGVSAMQVALQAVIDAAPHMQRASEIGQLPVAQRVSAWTTFINQLNPGTIRGDISLQDAENWFNQQWLPNQARNIGVNVQNFQDLARKMRLVQAANITRVEIRACNMGDNQSALRTLKQFLGVDRLIAPRVGTFYVPLTPFVSDVDSRMRRWQRNFAGPVRHRIYAGTTGPSARTFSVIVPASHDVPMAFTIPDGVQLRVWEVSMRPHLFSGRAASLTWVNVRCWVNQYLQPLSSYHQGQLVVSGLWTRGQGTNPDFTLPLEPGYRSFLVSV